MFLMMNTYKLDITINFLLISEFLNLFLLNPHPNYRTVPELNYLVLHLPVIVTLSESGTLHQVRFIKNSKHFSRQLQPEALKVYLCNNLIILVTLHCVSLSCNKGKRFVSVVRTDTKQKKKKNWQQKVTAIVLNDKVDNSQGALLNIAFE